MAAIRMELEFGDGFRLRKARPEDQPAMRRVCLLTGDSGRDASGREDDPDLLGLIYAVPYQVHSPEFAFVIEGPDGVCGYVLGTPDSALFYDWMREVWLPPIAQRLSDPGPDQSLWRGSDWARSAIHHPDFAYPPVLHPYPAHAHIDLLEPARGRNIGRRSLTHLMQAFATAGVRALHLGVGPSNRSAQAFYRKLGFERLTDPSLPRHTVFMTHQL